MKGKAGSHVRDEGRQPCGGGSRQPREGWKQATVQYGVLTGNAAVNILQYVKRPVSKEIYRPLFFLLASGMYIYLTFIVKGYITSKNTKSVFNN